MSRTALYPTLIAGVLAIAFCFHASLPALRDQALRNATLRGDTKAIAQLLREGASPDLRLGPDGETLLIRAGAQGDRAGVLRLLQHGADPGLKDYAGRTALSASVAGHHNDILQDLLQAREGEGEIGEDAALVQAVMSGNTTAVTLLLRAGADPDAHAGLHGDTPLLCAVNRGDPRLVEILLSAGADPNAAPGLGETALTRARHLRASKARRSIERLLLEAGAR